MIVIIEYLKIRKSQNPNRKNDYNLFTNSVTLERILLKKRNKKQLEQLQKIQQKLETLHKFKFLLFKKNM